MTDFAGGDYFLVWPKPIVAAEVDRLLRVANTATMQQQPWRWTQSVHRLLQSAFQGPEVAEEFAAHGSGVFPDYLDQGQRNWLHEFRDALDEVKAALAPKPYWSQRRGAQPQPLEFPAVADRYAALIRRLDSSYGLWSEAFGVDCPDGVGEPPDTPAGQIEDRLGRKLGALPIVWPPTTSDAAMWTPDDLYDLIEVLQDLASWPGTWNSHNHGGCPGHPGDFSANCGQALYRHEVNQLLDRSQLGMRLADAGEDRGRVVVAETPPLAEAVDEALAAAPTDDAADVAHAVALYRQRGRDLPTMRSAIVTLAGILEKHRALLKKELLSKDEGRCSNWQTNSTFVTAMPISTSTSTRRTSTGCSTGTSPPSPSSAASRNGRPTTKRSGHHRIKRM